MNIFPFSHDVLLLPPTSIFFSSDLHESQDRVWCRLGGGSCPHLPPRGDANARDNDYGKLVMP